jgi:3-keto-5-aminohexanoate cleavage enzyme
MENKIILTVAPTGALPTREMNPSVPLTPQEIAAQVYECWKQGAAVAHIHTRDKSGLPTSDVEVYREVMTELDKRPDCDIIRQLSTGARMGKDYRDRGQMLCLAPEMASLATGSSNFATRANFNDPETVSFLAAEMRKYKIKPEIEVFDTAMLWSAFKLADKGEIFRPLHINLVLGVPGSQPASEKALFYLYDHLPKDCTWGVTVIGREHVKLSVIAMALGGHVRVGLEDNIYHAKGVLATNLGLFNRMKNIALAMGRELATPAEARQMLGLASKAMATGA